MSIFDEIKNSFSSIPQVEGPIPVTEASYPFCAMKHSRVPLDVADYNYVEEEYFISGHANVYDTDQNDEATLYKAGLPYKTRIIVRKPSDVSRFSGIVYVDILNATQGYDIEDLWHRIYLWCMENGHGYVGVTSKPVNVQSLKNFDYNRYKTLNWPSGEPITMPPVSNSATLPGTEEGLIWDILGQTGHMLKTNNSGKVFEGYQVRYVYLTGQSQSGAYLNTFIGYFDRAAKLLNGEGIFDGYMNIVGSLVQRSIRQNDQIGPLRLTKRNIHPSTMPYICLSSEADLTLFKLFVDGELLDMKVQNSDTATDKCRYYEIPCSPHTDIVCPVLTDIEDIRRMNGKIPNLDPKLLEHINDMHVEYYICGLLWKLHRWSAYGETPEELPVLARRNHALVKDRWGNTEGGLRTPYVDVPIATYIACNPDDPEGICGKMEYFTHEQFSSLYGTTQKYLELFSTYTDRQVCEHWISRTDGEKMKAWSRQAVNKLR